MQMLVADTDKSLCIGYPLTSFGSDPSRPFSLREAMNRILNNQMWIWKTNNDLRWNNPKIPKVVISSLQNVPSRTTGTAASCGRASREKRRNRSGFPQAQSTDTCVQTRRLPIAWRMPRIPTYILPGVPNPVNWISRWRQGNCPTVAVPQWQTK